MVETANWLTAHVVNVGTVNEFKNAYNRHYCNDMDYAWITEANQLASPSSYKYK